MRRVCIATAYLGPLQPASPIGHAYLGLARELARKGEEVTVVHLRPHASAPRRWAEIAESLRGENIRLEALPPARPRLNAPPAMVTAYTFYQWLKSQSFDSILTHELGGAVYYALLARREGMALGSSSITVDVFGPTLWRGLRDQNFLPDLDHVCADFMERACLHHADRVIVVGEHLGAWMEKERWSLSRDRTVVPCWPTPPAEACPPPTRLGRVAVVARFREAEYEMWRRLLAAVRQLGEPGLNLVWLQEPEETAAVPGREEVEARSVLRRAKAEAKSASRAARARIRVHPIGSLPEMEEELGRVRGTVLLSDTDTAAWVVSRAVQRGIPLLASSLALLRDGYEERSLELLRAPETAEPLLQSITAQGRGGWQEIPGSAEARRSWRTWIDAHCGEPEAATTPATVELERPKVCVCLVHHDRPLYLRQALDSIRRQDYPNLEVVLVDDGSTEAATLGLLKDLESEFQRRRWKLVRQPNRYLGAARNTGANEGTGKYLLFMDDDNVLKSGAVERFVQAAEWSQADVVTSAMDVFFADHAPGEEDCLYRWLPLGGSLTAGLLVNRFGDANALWRRDTFLRLGGFSEDYGTTHEDWELFARALLQGTHLEIVPEPLFWYRVGSRSMLRTTQPLENLMRGLRSYLKIVPQGLEPLVYLVQGQHRWMSQERKRPRMYALEMKYQILKRLRNRGRTTPATEDEGPWPSDAQGML